MDNRPPGPLLITTFPWTLRTLHSQRIQSPLIILRAIIRRRRPNTPQIRIKRRRPRILQPFNNPLLTLTREKPRPATKIVIRVRNQQIHQRDRIVLRSRNLILRQIRQALRIQTVELRPLHVPRALARVRGPKVVQRVFEVAGLEGDGAEHGGLRGGVADLVGLEGGEERREGLGGGAAFGGVFGAGAGVGCGGDGEEGGGGEAGARL